MPHKKTPLPPMYEHPALGKFKRDRNGDYVGAIGVGRRQIRLVLECGFEDPRKFPDGPRGAAQVAASCLSRPDKFIRDAVALAAARLLPIKNRDWLEPGERKVGLASFLKKLRLKDITVNREGGALWFDDGMMFSDHVVVVGFDARGRLKDASIEG